MLYSKTPCAKALDKYPIGVYNRRRGSGDFVCRIFRKKEERNMEHEEGCPCCHKTKERTEEEYTKLIHRLNRIEGQIRGIRGMTFAPLSTAFAAWWSAAHTVRIFWYRSQLSMQR